MRRCYWPPPPPPSQQQQSRPLHKQRSWSPEVERDETWLRRKESYGDGPRRSQSFSNDDLEELKGCIELGFGFETNSPELYLKLSDTLPTLPFYCAVNRQYSCRLLRTSSASSIGSYNDAGDNIIDKGKFYYQTNFPH
ncbi:hypothetical protein F3Y22_tig00111644pilonHSYRG00081 [Hibiscus syriacus]|uniref:Uncharacterized protein n=1 Tax=Hibiscus syriacus TaxID=106335 RepID=A0A6A2XI03_HIBSY|nr:hypothetical protein F3Y22_tig00111644pilonHSYRG00081 [Hibiscus syriacus]